MAGDASLADAIWAAGKLSDQQAQAILDALDAGFEQVVAARYGGAISCVLAREGTFTPAQVLRTQPLGIDEALTVELHLQTGGGNAVAAGSGRTGGALATPIGQVLFSSPAAVDDIHIITEVFDDHDPNHHAEVPPSHEGVTLDAPDGSAAGHVPGGGITVVRHNAAAESGPARRGWQPSGQRTQVSRGLGLGNNGHSRASVTAVRWPVAAALLGGIGQALAQTRPEGAAIARVVIGLGA